MSFMPYTATCAYAIFVTRSRSFCAPATPPLTVGMVP